jgi:beta-galactosidase/beta-glucuronidase
MEILPNNSRMMHIMLHIDQDGLEVWNPDSPHTYNLRIELRENKDILFKHTETIGIREIQWEHNKYILNKELWQPKIKILNFALDEFSPCMEDTNILKYLKKLKSEKYDLLRAKNGFFTPKFIELATHLGFFVQIDLPIFIIEPRQKYEIFREYFYQINFSPGLLGFSFIKPEDKSPVYEKYKDYIKLFLKKIDPTTLFLE